jgi:hypothetical protein
MQQATLDLVRSYKMENIREVTDSNGDLHIIIDHGNEQFTSMLKSTYEAQQAALSTPMVIDDPKS